MPIVVNPMYAPSTTLKFGHFRDSDSDFPPERPPGARDQWIERSDAESVVLSDATGTFGLKRTDTNEVLIPAGQPFTRIAPGLYELTIDLPIIDAQCVYVVRWVNDRGTFHSVYTRRLESRAIDITYVHRVGGVPTDADEVMLTDAANQFGVADQDTDEIIVPPNGIALTRVDVGTYTGRFSARPGTRIYRYAVRATTDEEVTYYEACLVNTAQFRAQPKSSDRLRVESQVD